MSSDSSPSYVRILIKFGINIGLVWALATYMSQYFQLSGGIPAYIIVGALLTLLNIFARPILAVLTMPFKLFATILALIIVNGAFVQLVHVITLRMDPALIQLEIFGGIWGWTVIAVSFGFTNWVAKEILK